MRGRISLLAVLALTGGIAAVVGSALAWVELSIGPMSQRARGIDGWEGKAAIVGGVVMLAPAIGGFVGSTDAGTRLRTALIGGLIAAGVGTYTALTVDDQVLEAAAEANVPTAIVRDAIASGSLQTSLEGGLYIVIAGGALGMIAGILAFGARANVPRVPAGGTEGAGLTGWAAPVHRTTPDPTAPAASPWVPPSPGETTSSPDR